MFKSGANYSKLKTNLRLTINRLKLLEKKKTEIALKSRKEIADYIASGKDDRARIRVEHIIREDYLVEAMELLEMYCDLLLARFGLIQTQKEIDPGLEEAIATLIWATPRLQTDVQELKAIADELTAKYGKEFGQSCRSNSLSNVSDKVMHKLSVQAPPKALVEKYMVEIAKAYNVPFAPDASILAQDEVLLAENLLIDFDADKKGGGGGPSGGMRAPQPLPSTAPYPAAAAAPPALPSSAPVGPSYPPAYNGHPAKTGPPPNFNDLYDKPNVYDNPGVYDVLKSPPFQPPPAGFRPGMGAQPPPKSDDVFPDLPTVPTNSLPDISHNVGGSSAGGEDVDFDDLTRRFEALKKKK